MDNQRYGIRASGYYATYNGHEYFAYNIGDRVRLLSDEDPLPDDFKPSAKTWVKGEAIVGIDRIQHSSKVQTVGNWRGQHFQIGIIIGAVAYVTYLGKDFDTVCRMPGMERPDKYEVIGEIPVAELADVEEHVTELPMSNNDQPESSQP